MMSLQPPRDEPCAFCPYSVALSIFDAHRNIRRSVAVRLHLEATGILQYVLLILLYQEGILYLTVFYPPRVRVRA